MLEIDRSTENYFTRKMAKYLKNYMFEEDGYYAEVSDDEYSNNYPSKKA